MIAFLILGFLGMTVNMMVMFGMVLTVGMLVDGAIVVSEYADRKIEEGVEPRAAYTRSAQLMFWPVVSSTLTTLAAFLPLLLWPGVAGAVHGLPAADGHHRADGEPHHRRSCSCPSRGRSSRGWRRTTSRFGAAILATLGFLAILFSGLVFSDMLSIERVVVGRRMARRRWRRSFAPVVPMLMAGRRGLALSGAFAVHRLARWGSRAPCRPHARGRIRPR